MNRVDVLEKELVGVVTAHRELLSTVSDRQLLGVISNWGRYVLSQLHGEWDSATGITRRVVALTIAMENLESHQYLVGEARDILISC